MQQLLILLIVFGGLVSCETQVNSSVSKETKGNPSKEFNAFTKELASNGMFSDTARVNKLGAYGLGIPTFVKGKPFYYLDYSSTHIAQVKTVESPEAFKKAESIWAYYYREKADGNMVTDGVIEQWTFSNETDAKAASEAFQKVGEEIFFNTTPYHCSKGNVLYIFHTRAMAFSFPQKKVFESFKAK